MVIPASDSDAKLSELRAVTKYLRKEEIVDLQLELGKQENARLKTQIGHVTRDLEDTAFLRQTQLLTLLVNRSASALPLWLLQMPSTRS